MTREEAKEMLPIIKAFAEGKVVQYKFNTGWESLREPSFIGSPNDYRIKTKPKYRPFASKEECWQEMHKHPDFGWVNYDDSICFIQSISPKGITITDWAETNSFFFDKCLENNLTFTDGIPFGIMGLE